MILEPCVWKCFHFHWVGKMMRYDVRTRLMKNRTHFTKTSVDVENRIIKNLKDMNGENISYGIKKSVKNGFINKRMFDLYNDLVKKYYKNFIFNDVVLILQSYALCKHRNFEIYSILSNRALHLFREYGEQHREQHGEQHREQHREQHGEQHGEQHRERHGEQHREQHRVDSTANHNTYSSEKHDNIYRYIIASKELNYTDYELMHLFLKEIKKYFYHYDMKRICNILHALSKLKINDEELLEMAGAYILKNMDQIKSNHINHLISTYSKNARSNSSNTQTKLCFALVKYIHENIKSMDSISVYNILVQISPIIKRLGGLGGGKEEEEEGSRPHECKHLERQDETLIGARANGQLALRQPNGLNINTSDREEKRKINSRGKKREYNADEEETLKEDYCYLDKGKDHWVGEENVTNYNEKILKNIIPLLFSRVNTCLAFLSLNQLIKLLGAYKDLNYFHYTFVYKRLLHFLLSKLKTKHKVHAEEYIYILEFFTLLPYVDHNMEEIINITTENLQRVLLYNYEHMYRLLLCCKHLEIYNDGLLSKMDDLIFKNKRKFEKTSTIDDLEIFLHFYSKGSGEWDEIISFLKSIVELKAREVPSLLSNSDPMALNRNGDTNGDTNGDANRQCVQRPVTPSQVGKMAIITHKYNKVHKNFQECEKSVCIDEKLIRADERNV
ncbi:hypothetical protein, conserved [Plasmodium gonderi]|uniref:Uncharacterized protein n=1 Tax=Plasmodium gonderi TaxID=77519 RepID=A0A1Y1JBH6_PLAGO|nr:hypothetical protein, conserved [Plasmodium gonderi]GAW79891.1 hypothetical protein, conserved [Plasmodium gonderi]